MDSGAARDCANGLVRVLNIRTRGPNTSHEGKLVTTPNVPIDGMRAAPLLLLVAACSLPADGNVQRRLAKGRDANRLLLTAGRLVSRLHPAIAALEESDGFAADRPPRFVAHAQVTDEGSGLCVLQWAPAHESERADGEHLTVGTLTFTLNSTNPVVVSLEEQLGACGCELNNVNVMDSFRGHGGGAMLTERMLVDLRARRVDFVYLHRLDRLGNGGLRRWYERIGFCDVRDVLPERVLAHAITESGSFMIGLVNELFA